MRGAARVCRSRCLNSTTEEVRAPPFGSGCRPAMPPTPHPTARAAGTLIHSLGMGWERAGACLLTSCGGRPVSVPSVDSRGAQRAHAPRPRRVAAPPAVLPPWPPPRTHPGGRNPCQASHWAQEQGTGWGGSAVPRRRRFSFASERARAHASMRSVPSPPPAPRPPALPLLPPARPPAKGKARTEHTRLGGDQGRRGGGRARAGGCSLLSLSSSRTHRIECERRRNGGPDHGGAKAVRTKCPPGAPTHAPPSHPFHGVITSAADTATAPQPSTAVKRRAGFIACEVRNWRLEGVETR